MTAEPYTSAKRVFSVVDNGSSKTGQDRSNISAPTLCLVVVLPCDVVASGTVNLAFAAAA